MGKENEDVVKQMEDMLEEDEKVVEAVDENTTPDETKTQAPKTTTVTDEQINITQDIAKIDVEIQNLKESSVDVDEFYSKLDEHLSEDEQALEFEDKPAYMKLVNTKLQEFETKHSKSGDIKTLEDEKKEMQAVYERQSAIVEVSSKYPQYNHEKMMSFFNDDLSKTQQKIIIDNSTSYADVYEKAYEEFVKQNPSNIKAVPSPNIPDLNKSRKELANSTVTDDGLAGEDEKLRDALGL